MSGPCGTYGGYQAHRRLGEPTCEPCRCANRDHARDRNRAVEQLIVRHKVEFDALLADERARSASEHFVETGGERR